MPLFQLKGRWPDFLVIGAQRCGTTTFFHYLSQHPRIIMPPVKEVHFFDVHYAKGTAWYRSLFPNRLTSWGKVTGEASPYYLFHPLAPLRVAALLPNVKLILLLRDPVDRAFSQFHHERKRGFEPLTSFEEAIRMEPVRTAGEEERLTVDEQATSDSFRHQAYLARGLYFRQIQRWLRYFKRSQMLFLKSEDLYQDPAGTLKRTHAFLGVPHRVPGDLSARNGNSYAQMDPALRQELRRWFEEDSRQLAELLGPHFTWK